MKHLNERQKKAYASKVDIAHIYWIETTRAEIPISDIYHGEKYTKLN